MTVSSSVDVSDSLDEAKTRLLRSARALTRTWAALLWLMLLLVLLTLAALLVAITIRPTYVVIWSVLLAATSFNVTRFWPRRRELPGVVLGEEEARLLRFALDPREVLVWPARVRLVARPELEVTGGELVVGMPLLACLDEAELRELSVVATEISVVERDRVVRWALRVAHGEIGRSLVGRSRPRLTWPTYRLSSTLRAQSAALVADLENWAGACHRASLTGPRVPPQRRRAHVVAEQVIEGWDVVSHEWLTPAYERGRRHVEPFSGLRRFLEGADAQGWLPESGRRWPGSGPVAELVARHEDELSLQLAAERTGGRPDRLRPISWADHPSEVTVPHWRALVAEVHDVARRWTRDSDAVRLETLLALLEAGEGPALAEATAQDRDLDTESGDPAYASWSTKFVPRVLNAAIGIAAVDAHAFHPTWSWPQGAGLADEDGWALPVEAIVSELLGIIREGRGLSAAYGELRIALTELGIHVDEPLWLDHASGRPEDPIGSFVARQGLAARLVVVTDRALHVFEHPQGPRLLQLFSRPDPRDDSFDSLRKRMLIVWQGDSTDEVATVLRTDRTRARFGPATGGLWWRLRVGDGRHAVVLRGRGEGYAEETVLADWLGPQLATSWLHAPDRVRRNRDRVGRIGIAGGGAAVLAGAVVAVFGLVPAIVPLGLAVVGAAALAGAFVPDLAAGVRARQRLSSPTGTGLASVLPSGASGHAQAGSYAQDGA